MRKVKEPIRGIRFGTRMDSTNAVQQQMTRFTHGEENGKADGVGSVLWTLQETTLKACRMRVSL